jgi:hypothetical protein
LKPSGRRWRRPTGDNVGLVFADVERSQLSPGDVLTSPTVS